MGTLDMTGALMFGTLGIGLLIAVVLLMAFLRKRRNRHPMQGKHERSAGERHDDVTKIKRR